MGRRLPCGFTEQVFVADEVLIPVGFATARSRLAGLNQLGTLLSASSAAYKHGITGAARAGAALSELVRVQTCQLADAGGSAGLAIRWEAAAPDGGLFPVLDADIRLVPAGDEVALLSLTGAYRPLIGALGVAVDIATQRKMGAATMRNFIASLAADITGRPRPAEALVPGGPSAAARPSVPPGSR